MYALHSKLYQLVVKPLISIRTTGSIDVERAVKPIKKDILIKSRNKLSDNKAMVLFRTSENLRQLMKIKQEFKKNNSPILSVSSISKTSLVPLSVCRGNRQDNVLLDDRGDNSSDSDMDEH